MSKSSFLVASLAFALIACAVDDPQGPGKGADPVKEGAGEKVQEKEQKPPPMAGGAANDGQEHAKDEEQGQECGGPKEIQCAKGYVCEYEGGPTEPGTGGVK